MIMIRNESEEFFRKDSIASSIDKAEKLCEMKCSAGTSLKYQLDFGPNLDNLLGGIPHLCAVLRTKENSPTYLPVFLGIDYHNNLLSIKQLDKVH